jgi:hypothetical protein
MKLKLLTIPGSLLIVMILFFASCTKEGPAGPAGATGPAGPAGPTGAQGPKGDTGTANVIYSGWLDVSYLPDTVQTPVGSAIQIDTIGYYADITAPKLTNTILNTGEIKVYVNFGSSAQPVVNPLPHLYNFTLDYQLYGLPWPVVFTISPTFVAQRIALYSDFFDPSTVTSNGQKVRQVRYILIPGGTPSGRYAKINWDNYDEVKAYLNLKD